MELRRIALRGLVAVPLVAAGGIGLASYLPRLVRDRVVAQAKARTGLDARIGDVSLGLSSVTFTKLELGASGGGPRVQVREVEIGANPIMAALRGSAAIRAITARDLRVHLPIDSDSSRTLVDRLLRRGAGARTVAASERKEVDGGGDGRHYRVEGFELSVDDEHGALARVRGALVERAGGALTARVERATLGDAPGLQLRADGLTLQASTGRGVQLEELEVARARATLAERAGNGSVSQGEAEGDDDAAMPAGQAPEPPAESPSATTRARVLAALDRLRGADGHIPEKTRQSAAEQGSGLPILDRLTSDAVLAVGQASVRAADGTPVLEELQAKLAVAAAHQLAFSGKGSATGGGAISWDMQLWPLELRADGDLSLRDIPLSLLVPLLPSVPWHRPDRGRVDAQLVVKTETVQRIALSGEASIREAAISAARISAAPVDDIALKVTGRGHWLPMDKRLEVAQSRVEVGAAAVDMKGALEWTREHYLIDIDATLPRTPCTDALQAIPDDLLGELAVATWEGRIGGRFVAKVDSRALGDTVLEVDIDDRCQFATVPAMADLRRFRMPFMHSVLEPDGSVFEMETGPGTPHWTYLEDVSPFFVHAVLAHEDTRFFTHRGFSLPHIRNALVRNLKERRYVVGASTITMQLVKNVFLHREKTLARKIQEVLLTWWLERVMDKRDILELYVNVIEYGPGVYGIRNGARHYFNRLPSQLSPAESIYLSTILPNPKRYHSHFEKGELTSGWQDRMKKMFARMRLRGWYSEEAVDYGLRELQDFRFVPEGTVTEAREIPGTTAPLPYMRAYQTDWDWDAPDDFAEPEATADNGTEALEHAP